MKKELFLESQKLFKRVFPNESEALYELQHQFHLALFEQAEWASGIEKLIKALCEEVDRLKAKEKSE